MSGAKYTPIRTPEERIQDLERQNIDNQRRNQNLERALKEGQAKMERLTQATNEELRRREALHNNVVNRLTSDIKQIEIANQEKLEQQRKAFEKVMADRNRKVAEDIKQIEEDNEKRLQQQGKEFNDKIGKLADWTNEELRKQRQEYREIAAQLENEIVSIQGNIETLRDDVDNLINAEEARRLRAQERLKDLEILAQDIRENYPHERFTPAEYNGIVKTLNDAREALNSSNTQEASVYIREGLEKLTKLRENILKGQMKYDITYNETMRSLTELLERIKDKDVPLNEEGANRIRTKELKKIDFWTDEKYSELEKKLDRVKALLEQNKDTMTIAEIQGEYKRVGELEAELNRILNTARNRLLASMQREDIAEKIAQELADPNGFYTVDNGFESGDPKASYVISTRLNESPQSPEIIVVLEPKEISDSGFQNVLVINTTGDGSDREKQLRAERINAVLRGLDIETGNTTEEHSHIKELEGKDIKGILKEGSTGIPKHIKERISIKK
jgi:hypothetical protein|nr:hypothetical protein [uncultured Capnocytophaga sp.]